MRVRSRWLNDVTQNAPKRRRLPSAFRADGNLSGRGKERPDGRLSNTRGAPLTSRISPASSARRCPPSNFASPSSCRIERQVPLRKWYRFRIPRGDDRFRPRASSPPPTAPALSPGGNIGSECRLTRARHVTRYQRARRGRALSPLLLSPLRSALLRFADWDLNWRGSSGSIGRWIDRSH